MAKAIKRLIWFLISKFGRPIRDERTGMNLGRAIVWPWFGNIRLVGLHRPYVRSVFLPETTLKYARHLIGFATHQPVDFPRVASPQNEAPASDVLYAILFHLSQDRCEQLLTYWENKGVSREHILIVHGGDESSFSGITHKNKVFISDAGLRTRRHPVEKQSYAGPLREISLWLASRPNFGYVCFAEYDHLPLVTGWGDKLRRKIAEEGADVLFHHLTRVDGTNAPHYLYHLADRDFAETWMHSSLREDKCVVLNCITTGSFWVREAFMEVANTPETHPIYQEMYLPTQAHHLGFRVIGYKEQDAFVDFDALSQERIRQAVSAGAWSVHPVKDYSLLINVK